MRRLRILSLEARNWSLYIDFREIVRLGFRRELSRLQKVKINLHLTGIL